ncbi:MAG TPA: protein kinase [Terriglobia bacterium]|nr:protein kinase [Terriglobia bacterium]
MKSCPTCEATYPNTYAVCPQDGTPLVDLTAWSPGTLVRGKYRIISKVGQGGMGAVYKALHVAFDEMRALKVISRELMTDELFVKRFRHEAVITRKLQHPNAVRVDDIDEAEDGRPFIVMEFIEGQSLKQLIHEHGALPVPRVCSIVKQVAAALEAAHGLGLVHRDIKPDNIVLIETASGEEAKVLDFGIAKLKESRAAGTGGLTLTGTGVVIGTPQYMSPEQAMGKRGDDLDGRSDLYSLGVVMYQMLTGDLPFKADTTMEMLLAHLQKPPTPINILRPELQIPESVATLVMKTLEKDRELRPKSAKALIQEIERAESGPEPLGATRVIQPASVYTPRPAEVLRAAMQAKRAQAQQPAAPPTMPVASMETPRTEAPTAATSPSGPVAAAPPAPVARPAPALARPEAKSRWGIWASIAILVVALGGAAWYFTSRQPAAPSQEATSPPVSGPAEPKPAKSDEPAASQPQEDTTAPAAQEVKQAEPASEPEQTSTIPPAATRATPTRQQGVKERVRQPITQPARSEPAVNPLAARPSPLSTTAQPARVLPPQRTAVDPKQISAAITLGTFYLDHGDYDKAIAEFQKGLRLDSSNQTLRESLRRAQRAKAAEERILQ